MVYGELGRHLLKINYFAKAVKFWCELLHMDATRIPYQGCRMLVSLDSNGKCNWVTKLRLLLHETGFGCVWLTQGVGDEQYFIQIFRQRLTDINFQEWVVGLNASSRFDLYCEFKTALNAETYLDCIKQKWFTDCLVCIRLGISNLKVHKNRYARSEVLMDNDCPFCPGMQDNVHLFFVCKK